MPPVLEYIIWGIVALVFLITTVLFLTFIKLWLRARLAKAPVSLIGLLFMKWKGIPPALLVEARIRIVQAGIPIPTAELEAHHLAGGDLLTVANAIVAAFKANMSLTFQDAAAIDLAGRDILDAVHTSVKPKVIDCPDPNKAGSGMLDAVARDGIRLLVKARVTVRANLERLVFGATEDTIIARVGQGIVSAIGSSTTYKDVLENPDKISRKVLDSGLDAQTAFEIVSIDIADISVAGVSTVANVGALLETERAEADKKLRQAEAEGRRAMALASEQEMKARVQEMRARVVESEAQVPLAMAQAFRDGNLGVMDAYRLRNINADTDMRASIAGAGTPPSDIDKDSSK